MPSRYTLTWTVLLVVCCLRGAWAAATCYSLVNSTYGSSSGISPCDPNATGETGSHSACCHFDNADACLSSGLCLNTLATVAGHLVWATGCTDPTFKDPSCPKVCVGPEFGTAGNYNLRSCNVNGTTNTWCCGDDAETLETCCENSFTMPSSIGTVVKQLSSKTVAAAAAASTSTQAGTTSSAAVTTSSAAAATSTTSNNNAATNLTSTSETSTCAVDSTSHAQSNIGYVAAIAVLASLLVGSHIALCWMWCYTRQVRRGIRRDPSIRTPAMAAASIAHPDPFQQNPFMPAAVLRHRSPGHWEPSPITPASGAALTFFPTPGPGYAAVAQQMNRVQVGELRGDPSTFMAELPDKSLRSTMSSGVEGSYLAAEYAAVADNKI